MDNKAKNDSNIKTSCPYTYFKNIITTINDTFNTKLIDVITEENYDNIKKITFKNSVKALELEDITYKIPNIDSAEIDELYNEVNCMTDKEREEYTKPFYTLEGYQKEAHMRYNQMGWLLMEYIIQEIMDELVIVKNGVHVLNIPEFTDDKWLEIGDNTLRFEKTLNEFFKIKVYKKLYKIESAEKESDVYKLKKIIFTTNMKGFMDVFIDKGINASISNISYVIQVALDGISSNDGVISIKKLEECISNNSNQLIIDLSRSKSFLVSLFENQSKHFYYNKTKNSVEFNLALEHIDGIGSPKIYPDNQYSSCPMIRSKSTNFGKQSNKILDFTHILSMFFYEFIKKNSQKNTTSQNK